MRLSTKERVSTRLRLPSSQQVLEDAPLLLSLQKAVGDAERLRLANARRADAISSTIEFSTEGVRILSTLFSVLDATLLIRASAKQARVFLASDVVS
jgi:hypothetical protein